MKGGGAKYGLIGVESKGVAAIQALQVVEEGLVELVTESGTGLSASSSLLFAEIDACSCSGLGALASPPLPPPLPTLLLFPPSCLAPPAADVRAPPFLPMGPS